MMKDKHVASFDVPKGIPKTDYVLVYSRFTEQESSEQKELRKRFEQAVKLDGLCWERENHAEYVFLKLYVPFDRLAEEADRIKLEMPLKGCSIEPTPPLCCTNLIRLFETDTEVDFVSAPFEYEKAKLYEGIEDKLTFFSSAQRGFLCHHILINTDINEHLRHDTIPSSVKIELEKHKNKRRNSDDDEDEDAIKRKDNFSDSLVQKEAKICKRQQERCLKIKHFTSNSSVGKNGGLLYLLMKKAYTDAFTLHDPSADDPIYSSVKEESLDEYYIKKPNLDVDARKDMNRTWTVFWKFQPMWMIRNYFGEKIAFYFAWVGTLLTLIWVPTIVGLLLFFYGLHESVNNADIKCPASPNISNITTMTPSTTMAYSTQTGTTTIATPAEDTMGGISEKVSGWLDIVNRAFDNITTPFFSILICFWGALFLEVWKRTQFTHAYEWDVNNYEDVEPDRPQFMGTKIRKDPVTAELQWIYPVSMRIRKYLLSSLIVVFMILVVFASVTGVIVFKVQMKHFFHCNPHPVTNKDHPEKNGAMCVLFGTVAPTLMNALSVQIMSKIYGHLVETMTDLENHRTQTDHNDSLIIKLFAFHFANSYASLFYLAFIRPEEHGFQPKGILNMGTDYKDTCKRGECMRALSFQVFVLMVFKPIPKFFKDIVWPYIVKVYKQFRRLRKKTQNAIVNIADQDRPGSSRPGTTESGRSAINVMKNETFTEREYQKPALGDFTLSEYTEKVLEFGYLILFSASFPLAPLITVIVTLSDLRVDAKRLLWFNRRPIAYIAFDIGMWYHILNFIVICGIVSNGFIVGYTSSFLNKWLARHRGVDCAEATTAHRLLAVIIFEHIVAVSIYVINVLIPDIPSKIKLAQRKEKYQINKILEQGEIRKHIDVGDNKKKKRRHSLDSKDPRSS